MNIGHTAIRVVRTETLEATGFRSVWYLPDGSSVHAIEDDPIDPGCYYLVPDDTGRFQNWVIVKTLGTREASFGRIHVEVHAGNKLADTDACTCPGMETTSRGVARSRDAIKHLRKVLKRDHPDPPVWVLHIIE